MMENYWLMSSREYLEFFGKRSFQLDEFLSVAFPIYGVIQAKITIFKSYKVQLSFYPILSPFTT